MLFHMKWTNLISDLLQRGYTYKDIGEFVGMTGANICALQSNPRQQPRWAAGQAMILLHKKAMRRYPKIDTAA